MAQPVDPFIPVNTQPIRLKKRQLLKPRQRVSNGKFDSDILPPPKQQAAPVRQQHRIAAGMRKQPTVNSIPQTKPRMRPQIRQTQPQTPAQKERRWLYYMKLLVACVVMLAVGSLAQVAVAGELFIGTYAVWALVKRVPSRITFLLALGTFAAILLVLIAKPDQVLLRNFSTYAFLFLLVGVISLTREARE